MKLLPTLILALTLLAMRDCGACYGATPQPATQPARDPSVAVAPNPPNIKKLTTIRSTRVMVSYDPTPIFSANPAFRRGSAEPDQAGEFAQLRSTPAQEYALKLGIATGMMVYEGTENRATVWHDGAAFRTLHAAANRFDLDWTLEANNCDPLNPAAARAIVALSREPAHFGARLLPLQPIILDIEHTAAYNAEPADAAGLAATLKAWTDRLDAYRAAMGYDAELYAYGLRGFARCQDAPWWTPELARADRAMMRRLSGYTASCYNWNGPAANPGIWFAAVDQADGYLAAHYPFLRSNKWATITPTYQIYWTADAATLALNGQPVPIELWQKQIRYLVDRGWNLLIWLPAGMDFKPIKPHLDFLAKYLQ